MRLREPTLFTYLQELLWVATQPEIYYGGPFEYAVLLFAAFLLRVVYSDSRATPRVSEKTVPPRKYAHLFWDGPRGSTKEGARENGRLPVPLF